MDNSVTDSRAAGAQAPRKERGRERVKERELFVARHVDQVRATEFTACTAHATEREREREKDFCGASAALQRNFVTIVCSAQFCR